MSGEKVKKSQIQVVCSNKVIRRLPTETNGTPRMEHGFEDIRIRRYIYKQEGNKTEYTSKTRFIIIICFIIIDCICMYRLLD